MAEAGPYRRKNIPHHSISTESKGVLSMRALNIFLLGDFSFRASNTRILQFPTKKSKSLLAYLAISNDRTFSRSTLAGEFWPERCEEQAKRSLNTEIWRLRKSFANAGLEAATFLRSDADRIGFRADSDHWVDANEFRRLTELTGQRWALKATSDDQLALSNAVALYKGHLAEGLSDDWCMIQREAYRARLLTALRILMVTAMEAKHWEDAVSCGLRLWELDALQEHVHRMLMHCYFALGNRPAALRQYAVCTEILRSELQIAPMPETTQLYMDILESSSRSVLASNLTRSELTVLPHQKVMSESAIVLAKLTSAKALIERACFDLEAAENWSQASTASRRP